MTRATLAACLAITLAACSGDDAPPPAPLEQVDEREFQAAVEEVHGFPIGDWDEYMRVSRDMCSDDALTFEFHLAMAEDRGYEDFEAMRLIVAYVCPAREGEVAAYEQGR